eukprot:5867292-Prymnesium_polylepis.1
MSHRMVSAVRKLWPSSSGGVYHAVIGGRIRRGPCSEPSSSAHCGAEVGAQPASRRYNSMVGACIRASGRHVARWLGGRWMWITSSPSPSPAPPAIIHVTLPSALPHSCSVVPRGHAAGSEAQATWPHISPQREPSALRLRSAVSAFVRSSPPTKSAGESPASRTARCTEDTQPSMAGSWSGAAMAGDLE